VHVGGGPSRPQSSRTTEYGRRRTASVQHAAFAYPHIARGRAFQRRDVCASEYSLMLMVMTFCSPPYKPRQARAPSPLRHRKCRPAGIHRSVYWVIELRARGLDPARDHVERMAGRCPLERLATQASSIGRMRRRRSTESPHLGAIIARHALDMIARRIQTFAGRSSITPINRSVYSCWPALPVSARRDGARACRGSVWPVNRTSSPST